MSKTNRPISPHLTIYKPQLTAVLSIFHRITGILLSVVAYLFLVSNQIFDLHLNTYSIYNIAHFLNLSSHWFLLGMSFIVLLSIYYHLFNGIRHLMWDSARGLEVTNVYMSGYLVVSASFLATLLTWLIFF